MLLPLFHVLSQNTAGGSVALSAGTSSQSNPTFACYAGFVFKSDGTIESRGPGVSTYTPINGGEWWSSGATAGIGSSYDVRFLSTGKTGTWTGSAAADDTWVQMNTDREWYIVRLSIASPGTTTTSGTFEIRETGTGSAIASAFFTASAQN